MDQEGWKWGVLSFARHEFSSLSQNPFNQPFQVCSPWAWHRCLWAQQSNDEAAGGSHEGQVRALEGDLAAWGRGRGIECLLALSQWDTELSRRICFLAWRAGSAGTANGTGGETGAMQGSGWPFWETPRVVSRGDAEA